MSAEKAEAPAEQKKPTVEELLAQLQAASIQNTKAIDLMAQAIVKLNEKIEAKPANPSGTDTFAELAKIFAPKSGSLEDFAKTAEGFARAADALDRFRHPSRIGVGEAMLMRLGLRAAFPRYMTKAELQRIERAGGIWEVLEEEGEEHAVTE